jgi:hypothetical protein
MSDYNYHGPEDPFRPNAVYRPGGSTAWGWVAAAVFVVVVLGLLISMGHQPGQPGTNTALNDSNPPITRMAPPVPAPSNVPPTTAAPAPATPAPPVAPTPGTPTQVVVNI